MATAVNDSAATLRVLVVADDLTGANAVGAAFAQAGLRAVTVVSWRQAGVVEEFRERFDVVAVNLGSRHADPHEAASRVRETVARAWPVELVCKRIDTTLRGNIGAEVAAALAAVGHRTGGRVVGLCLPAHPRAGRVTVDGTQLLHGRRVEDTELARDPRSPVRTSVMADVLAKDTDLKVAHVGLSVISGDAATLAAALQDAVTAGVDVVVGDALMEGHLQRLAIAAAEVAATDPRLRWVAIDPGPGSLALASTMTVRHPSVRGPLLAVSASATQLTRAQLQRLASQRQASVVPVVPTAGSPRLPDVPATVASLTAALKQARPGGVVLLASVLTEADLVDLDAHAAELFVAAMGRVTREVLQQSVVDGLFLTGGDLTAAVLEHLDARGLEITAELVPLAVGGALVGGPWSALPVVTKGGLVGDADTTISCLDHLAAAAARRVHAAAAASDPDAFHATKDLT